MERQGDLLEGIRRENPFKRTNLGEGWLGDESNGFFVTELPNKDESPKLSEKVTAEELLEIF